MAVRLVARNDSFGGPVNEIRSASTAGGGTALSTAAALIPFPDGTSHITLVPRNFTTAVVLQFALNPYMAVLFSNDSFAAVPVDNSVNAQDGLSATNVDFSALKTLANGGAIYIGSHLPFRGMKAVSVGANANASVLSGKYWNGSAWTAISLTDGTVSAGKTFAQSGDITWTVPATWAKKVLAPDILQAAGTPYPCGPFPNSAIPLYWVRLEVTAVLSATVTLSSLVAYNRSTAYGEIEVDSSWQCRIFKGVGGIAAVEALVDAGTGNLIVDVMNEAGGTF